VRWNSPDGKTLDEIREILSKTPTNLGSWYHSQEFGSDSVAYAWHISLDKWDQLSAEHKGRMTEIYHSRRTMNDWTAYLAEQRAERERRAQANK
jgi:hypothetical protein